MNTPTTGAANTAAFHAATKPLGAGVALAAYAFMLGYVADHVPADVWADGLAAFLANQEGSK
jgi:hypothetical protein